MSDQHMSWAEAETITLARKHTHYQLCYAYQSGTSDKYYYLCTGKSWKNAEANATTQNPNLLDFKYDSIYESYRWQKGKCISALTANMKC